MSQPTIGVLEADCRTTPVPAVGSVFTVQHGGKAHIAEVTRTGQLKSPRVRQMGVIQMVATHMVEFIVRNP